jgi:DNA-binding IclR family transcriptional regulator
VAAPVRRTAGPAAAVLAALSVSGPASRLTRSRIKEVAAQCVAQADALSAILGRPPAGKSQQEGAA